MPKTWKNKQLATWVGVQRTNKRNATLPPEKIKRLDALGFVWEPYENVWEVRFRELVAHKKKHGNFLVPRTWKSKQLATWVGVQRTNKRNATLSPEKIKRLDALGFVWDPVEQFWEERFRELVAYKKRHGDCLVPSTWKSKQLATWVWKQRAKRGTLSPEKIKRLNAIGFVWDIRK